VKKKLVNLSLCALGALAIAAVVPGLASAATPGSAANAKILNIVTVTYYDANGSTQHQAATSTSVSVALKQAPLTMAITTAFPVTDSGASTTSLIALTSNANGGDLYTVAIGATPFQLTGASFSANLLSDVTGGSSTGYTSGADLALGATSIVSAQAAAAGAQKLFIPAGTLNGIAVNSIVVINGTSYKVTAIDAGTLPGYTVTGQSFGLGAETTEIPGSITIVADPNGSNVAPNLSGSLAGTIIAERKYLQITDTAVVSSSTSNGTDTFSVSSNTKTGSNPAGPVSEVATFNFISLSIQKAVSNVTTPAAGSTGKPGEVLEYTVTVNNASTGNAWKVSIADAVPAYTTLVSGSGAYGTGGGSGAATEKFATIFDGANTVDVTLSATDSETQPGNPTVTGFGGTAGNAVVAGTAMNFFLGAGSSNALGGTVAANKTFVIKYQVKIN
jgi:uncharacterized repeat protein (TIGR01451 family)